LTLVVDLDHGSNVNVYYAESGRETLDDAVCDLMIREGTSKEYIGVCRSDGGDQCAKHPSILPTIHDWLKTREFDAAIWTDLESNYGKKRGCAFGESDALAYLNGLSPVCRAHARDYIVRAPEQTQTKLRKYLQSKGWL
jgi:hypothetical protein